jgi:hypothetical protein
MTMILSDMITTKEDMMNGKWMYHFRRAIIRFKQQLISVSLGTDLVSMRERKGPMGVAPNWVLRV